MLFRWRLVIVTLVILVLLGQPIHAQQGTVWGPTSGYEIAYVHTVIASLDGTDLIYEENLPVTDFRVEAITSSGYSYIYEGYGDRGFDGEVVFQLQNENDPNSYYPTGTFPVLIPLVFRGIENWPSQFVRSADFFNQSINFGNTVSPFISDKPALENDLLKFESNGYLTMSNYSNVLTSPNGLPQITHPRLVGEFESGTFDSKMEYNLDTGVLFKFELLFDTRNYKIPNSLAIHHLSIYQRIEFVVLIPPGIIVENIIDLELSLFFFIIFSVLLLRKQRF